jgi:uncharacterized protein (TIGR03435 family)
MRYAVLAFAATLAGAGLFAQAPRFEVASVKPSAPDGQGMLISGPALSQFTTRNAPLASIVMYAYARPDYQIAGGPDWIRSERFDIVAKYPNGHSPAQVPAMLRALLEDRFRLRTHVETREAPIYALVTARPDKRLGPELRRTKVDCVAYRKERAKNGEARTNRPGDTCEEGTYREGRDRAIWASGTTMGRLASGLASSAGRDVVDRTGLTGEFDVRLRWRPEAGMIQAQNAGNADDSAVSLFTAVQEQLGLRLESARGPVEFLVIDAVERPAPD